MGLKDFLITSVGELVPIPQYRFSGKRVTRRLYKASNGLKYNADVNGSLNILRKAVPNAFSNGVEGVVVHPVKVTLN